MFIIKPRPTSALSRRFAVVMVVAIAAGISIHLSAAPDAPFVDQYTRYCFNCHAADPGSFSSPRYPPPKLAGQDAAYLVTALKEYRKGTRNHYLMNSPAEMLPEQVLDGLAAYISNLDGLELPAYSAAAPDEKILSRGLGIAESHCMECHGADSQSSKAGVPILHGQHARYLATAIMNFRLGVRPHEPIDDVMAKLNSRQVLAVSEYYASRRGLRP